MATDESKKKGYEVRDAPASPVAIGLALLVGLMVAGFIGGQIFQDIFEVTEVKTRPAPEPLAEREIVEGPRLQAHPVTQISAYLHAERERLRSYGWVDRSAGVVRIPIERAMKLVLINGLPEWDPVEARMPEAPPAPEANGAAEGSLGGETTDSTESDGSGEGEEPSSE